MIGETAAAQGQVDIGILAGTDSSTKFSSSWQAALLLQWHMTDNPTPTPPRLSSRGLVLPPNCRETTAEHTGTVTAIVGAPKPPKAKPK
jgi:hypothetical protein